MIPSSPYASSECVIVLHGIGSGRWVMWPLAQRLRSHGYRVEQWSYRSLFSSIEVHAAKLHAFLKQKKREEECLHIVAHSMGCIVVRAAFAHGNFEYQEQVLQAPSTGHNEFDIGPQGTPNQTDQGNIKQPFPCGRVVFLAPPNSGSFAARLGSSLLGRIVPPTKELSDSPGSFVNQLPKELKREVGIIAARFDMLISVKNTHLSDEREHVELCATHNSLLFSSRVARRIVDFLQKGSFGECSLHPS